jgi:hypothetical protein
VESLKEGAANSDKTSGMFKWSKWLPSINHAFSRLRKLTDKNASVSG